MTPARPVLIVGVGAMACLFAARLSASGAQVTLLGSWAEALDALNRRGVTLVDVDGAERAYPVRAVNDPAEASAACDALVLVKAWQTPFAARRLAACLHPGGVALTLQNGAGNLETLAEFLGGERAALGVTTTGANLLGPGRVRLAGEGTISLQAHPRLGPLTAALRSAGFAVEQASDAQSLLWGKLVINAAINPLTAILGVSNGELLLRPSARELMLAAAREAAAVAAALGVSLPYADAPAMAAEVARRTAANRSSMLQDVQRGAPTEVDAICGAVVRAAQRAGVPAPVNRVLWQLVEAMRE
ncbi:MAG: 2-dehydropantoate 2-reductase [Chloroflexi bacterium]|nr:2-dehydropantoate 2-reductase [Chloroflexota bacterium]